MTPKTKEQEPEAPARVDAVQHLALRSLCTKIGSGATPRGGSNVYLTAGTPLIRSQNVYNGVFRPEGLAYISQTHADELAGVEVREGDILLNITGDSVARVCMADRRYVPARVNQHVAIVRSDPAKVSSRYLLYVLVSQKMQAHLLQLASAGATRNALTKGMIEALSVPVPPLDEQRRIAGVLGAYDNKIELNRRMNETLEAMARAIFKSWFVDFDPVRAKAEGRQPKGIPAHIADLFPNQLTDSPLGPIPKDWEVGRLDQFLQLKRGYDLPSKSRVEGPVPLCSASGITGSHNEAKVKGPGVVTGRSGLLGKVFLLLRDFWPLNTTLYVREFRRVGPYSAYHLLRHVGLDRFNAGSAVPTLNRNHVHNLPLPMAGAKLYQAFDDLVEPMYELIKANERESETLAETRDTLLPKLLSGEVAVGGAA